MITSARDVCDPLVILGASHAGTSLAAELRAGGCSSPIFLLGAESMAPYQRPHLSKESLEGAMPDPRALRTSGFFVERSIELRTGVTATAVDRVNSTVHLSDGTTQRYGRLFLATGARARRIPVPGANDVFTLRHHDDWCRLAKRLTRARRVLVVGGGMIGLEVAAAANLRGLDTTVVESGHSLMGRSLCAPLAAEALKRHRASGVTVLLGANVSAFEPGAVLLGSGERLEADVILAAVGSEPRDDLARDTGLATSDGVVVDHLGSTSDPLIHALGDCAAWPSPCGKKLERHESIAATLWQARTVAAAVTGREAPNREPLRLWSTQGALRFQMTGAVTPSATWELLDVGGGGILATGSEAGRITAIHALNAPRAFNSAVSTIGSRTGVAV